jgi:two-component system C4-dicarboxylate transport sensor histidine kinase DctB
MGGLIFATITTLGYLEQANKILPDTHWKKEVFVLGDAVEYSLLLFVILIISWLSNREIEKSLHRARSSEADLIKERDLLEIKVDERTQALRKAQLEKMSELYRFVEFGRLSSGVFHDLINPLNALSLNVGLLKSVQEAHTPEMQAYIQKALTASAKMETYIATVRKQIQMNNSPSTFCLNEEIQAAITVLEYKAKKNNVQMLFIEVDNINMYGSSIKFHQIATNLISNAIDAYDGFESTNSRIVLIELATSTKQIVFTVKDFGIGISIEIQKEIFEPFFTTKHSSKGSGLGLSTTKHIIERDFKGTISVSSQEPLGTIFEVLIPLSLDTSQDEQNTSKV